MIGDGPTKTEMVNLAEAKGLDNLLFLDRKPKSAMPEILASLDISLVPLAGRFPGTMPSKIYEALASGAVPITAKACEGESLLTQFDCGACFEPGDSNELAAAIRSIALDDELRKSMKQNGFAVSQRFDRTVIAKRTEKLLDAVIEGQSLPDVDW